MTLPFFTIGHSNHSLDVFVELLQAANIATLVDIRTIPKSRANPQFNEDALAESLSGFDIGYLRIGELGGLRGKSKSIAREANGFWENDSFHNYADYAMGDQFSQGLDQLISIGHKRRSAIMCSEAVWWRCHRRIVADYLLARGEDVRHIMGAGRIDPATMTAGAIVQPDRTIRYPGE